MRVAERNAFAERKVRARSNQKAVGQGPKIVGVEIAEANKFLVERSTGTPPRWLAARLRARIIQRLWWTWHVEESRALLHDLLVISIC